MARIELAGVTIDYPIFNMDRRSMKNAILRTLGVGGVFTKSFGQPMVRALDAVNLELRDGDRLGVIGHNGAGKSTFLRVLAGAYVPQKGTVHVQGTLVTLFNLRLGMDPTATGYKNIILHGLALGIDRRQIERRMDEIADFSELGPYLDMPMHTYSLGMSVRLGFAISTAMRPDILLMDEWVGAGDEEYLKKIRDRLHERISQTRILVLATHRLQLVKELCNKAMLLDHGVAKAIGPVSDVIHEYRIRTQN